MAHMTRVTIDVDTEFLYGLRKKLGKDNNGAVLIEGIELLSWAVDQVKDDRCIVSVNTEKGALGEKITTFGLNFYSKNKDL